jgi:gamma-glutamyltranspeptidase/glutathione hydrolase
MVAAKHPLGAEVGLRVLQNGGNAVDAAVTMAFALGVVEPQSSGLGGGGMMVIHEAASGRNIVIDYAMDAPLAAGPDAYELDEGIGSISYGWHKVKDDANVWGYRAASIPGAVRGLALALERYGTISLPEALAPAIRFAEEGIDTVWQLTIQIAASMRALSRFPASAAVFLPGGFPLRAWGKGRPADRLVQPDLARTLRLIAEQGPDAFYEGEVADAIVRAMREHDGLITADDLARYQPTVTEGGLISDYRDWQLVGVPGACGAITTQQGLKILEGFNLGAREFGTIDALHLQMEAFRLAFADRYRYVADPKQEHVPWHGLLSDGYAWAVRQRINPAHAAASVEPGDPWRFNGGSAASATPASVLAGTNQSSTTTLATVDADRNVVSLTQTLVNAFGSAVIPPGTGVLLNDAMAWFDPEPGKPNSAAPGKRGVNNMAPTLVLKHGRPVLAVGAVGGRTIIQAVAQVIMNVLDYDMGIQDAIAAPRIECSGPETLIDARFPDQVVANLRAMGHQLEVVEESVHAYHLATPVGILIDAETGRLHGGVDQLRLGEAAGY